MRLFFAIEFNEELKDYLFSIQKQVRQYCIGGNFTSKDNFHLTLRFIGEQSQQQAELLKSAMKATATSLESSTEKSGARYLLNNKEKHIDTFSAVNTDDGISQRGAKLFEGEEIHESTSISSGGACKPGFELRLSKIGKFDRGNKKILWVGLQRSQQLQALHNKLETNLFKVGYNKEERGYNPHITLAREVRIEAFDQLANEIKLNETSIWVNAISLMESKRINNKLCYVPIERVEFAGKK
ncbi:RNA 2',3'-cyclic phosphodiesterase [Ruminiclostridium herbifermentans]|nr:RNA 2',3'-cyclic phosphodiesterase [Ruminiclostridium herbifermentans]